MTGRQILLGIVIALGFLLLLSWGKTTGTLEETWEESASVTCLPLGHATVSQHIHAELHITVDGLEETLPVNVGIAQGCMAEVHTHEEANVIHVETVDPETRYSLGAFFDVWGRSFDREGYTASLFLNGLENSAGTNLMLKDGQVIEVRYESPEYMQAQMGVTPLEVFFPEEKEKKPKGPSVLQVQ